MKAILQIAWNDVRLFLKDKSGYLWLFLAPVGFIYITGIPGSGPQGTPSNPKPSVFIDNRDEGFLGTLLMEEMDTQGMRVLESDPNEEADRRIVIPEKFTDKIRERQEVKLDYITLEGSGEESAMMIEMRLVQATLGINAHLVEWATQTSSTNLLEEAELRELIADSDPVNLNSSFAGRKKIPSGFEQSLPGNLIMFMMMNLTIFGGTSIAAERKNGVLRRLATLPLTRSQIIIGKIAGRFLLGCILIVFFVSIGQFLFQVSIARAPAALFLTLGCFAWFAASLGVLIGSVTTSPEKAIGLCLVTSMLAGALGGCWWPLEIANETMQTVGHAMPTGWAMDALHQLISFGGGLNDILTEVAILATFAVGTNFLAARFLKFSEA